MTANIEYFDYLDAMEKMCDAFCKYPNNVSDQEVLDIICDKCPMNKLIRLNGEEGAESNESIDCM